MERKTYYMSVQSGEIFEDPTISTYEFIIEANPRELQHLQELLEKVHEKDGDTFIRSHLPVIQYHNDKENHEYDDALKQVYLKIYELGNDVSKRSIEEMGLLNE